MAYNEKKHVYEVEITKTYTAIFKVVAHSEEQANNEAWEYAQEQNFSEIEADPIEVNYAEDLGEATAEDFDEADVIAED